MIRYLKGVQGVLLPPLLVVSLMAFALYLLGMVPGYFQGRIGVKEYNSIEEAEAALGFPIVMPSYFPSYLSWPPAKILGQLEPVPMVQMVFLSSDQRTEALLVSQIMAGGEDLPMALPWVETVLEKIPITLEGSAGELIVGRRGDGRLVNGAYWRREGFHFVVLTVHPLQELITLARSMHAFKLK